MATKKKAEAAATSPEVQAATPAKSTVIVYSFDEFVGYGKCVQPHLSPTGMPWAWPFYGVAVTHESDDLYIINGQHFKRGDALHVTRSYEDGSDEPKTELRVITPKDTGDFDNELKYLDKTFALAERREGTIVELEPAQKSGREAIVEIIDHLKAKGDALTENEALGLRHLKLAVTALDATTL